MNLSQDSGNCRQRPSERHRKILWVGWKNYCILIDSNIECRHQTNRHRTSTASNKTSKVVEPFLASRCENKIQWIWMQNISELNFLLIPDSNVRYFNIRQHKWLPFCFTIRIPVWYSDTILIPDHSTIWIRYSDPHCTLL